MKIIFKYNTGSDVWCLMNYGKSSFNSSHATTVYKEMVAEFKAANIIEEEIDEDKCRQFVENYLKRKSINTGEFVEKFQTDWDKVSSVFQERAEKFFGVTLDEQGKEAVIDAELSINNRSPYNIEDSYFFCSFPRKSGNPIAMHELWHFYTWKKFGEEESEGKLGRKKYNDIKEALTVLLNVIFPDILDDEVDNGYSQHKDLRQRILDLWNSLEDGERTIGRMWPEIVAWVNSEQVSELKRTLK